MKQMVFVDEAYIKVRPGYGGDGGRYFHREKYVSHGGPSGGNGGNGGSVYLVGDNNESTLLDFKGKTLFKGQDGVAGAKNNMTGANGKDLLIPVPVGTEVLDMEGNVIADISFNGQK